MLWVKYGMFSAWVRMYVVSFIHTPFELHDTCNPPIARKATRASNSSFAPLGAMAAGVLTTLPSHAVGLSRLPLQASFVQDASTG